MEGAPPPVGQKQLTAFIQPQPTEQLDCMEHQLQQQVSGSSGRSLAASGHNPSTAAFHAHGQGLPEETPSGAAQLPFALEAANHCTQASLLHTNYIPFANHFPIRCEARYT